MPFTAFYLSVSRVTLASHLDSALHLDIAYVFLFFLIANVVFCEQILMSTCTVDLPFTQNSKFFDSQLFHVRVPLTSSAFNWQIIFKTTKKETEKKLPCAACLFYINSLCAPLTENKSSSTDFNLNCVCKSYIKRLMRGRQHIKRNSEKVLFILNVILEVLPFKPQVNFQ